MENEDEKRIFYESQYYSNQAKQVQQQIAQLETLLEENAATTKALENLSEQETLFPIGSGTYLRGTLSDKSKVLIDLGARVIGEKNVADAQKILEERKEKLETGIDNLKKTLMQLAGKLDELNTQTSKLQKQS
ncbi:MAG: prefoldin subunit alpha [Candidatus Micrarchaeia archaeon]